MKGFFNKLTIIFLSLLFCFFFFSLFFDYQLKTVVSGSMEPKISTGSLIVIVPTQSFEVGDIVTFKKGNALVTHRVVSISGNKLITAGDANDSPDRDPVEKSKVVGGLFIAIPLLGYFIEFIQTPFGLTIFIFIGLLIILLEDFFEKDEID